ncbi:MAG: RNA methyltransferase [Betaproteobacteria bacterium]|nr:RNA methyltransferase [Betaproteobacteria bacterium]
MQNILDRIVIVLCRTSHPGNIGAAARAMKTMGISRLQLVAPRHFPDPEATARAAGADDVLASARIYPGLADALAGTVYTLALSARGRDLGPSPTDAREAALKICAFAREHEEGALALVFGNETSGLSNEENQLCRAAAMIPSVPGFSSLNLGAAVQILCYELRLASFATEGAPLPLGRSNAFSSPPATHEEIEHFYAHLERLMIRTGFHDPERPRRLLPKLRRLFGRAALERDEVNILRGVLDAMEKSIGD